MALPTKKFIVRNDGFRCEHCGHDVAPTKRGTPRNHCPFCLYSKHVDINPGDRANRCGGLMEPTGVEVESRRGYVLLHRCLCCGHIQRNRAVLADPQPDDLDLGTFPCEKSL